MTADHTYTSDGPYAITVYVSDTRDGLGGVGATLANVINVTSDEDITKYVANSGLVASLADRRCLAGLTAQVSVNREQGTFSRDRSSAAAVTTTRSI